MLSSLRRKVSPHTSSQCPSCRAAGWQRLSKRAQLARAGLPGAWDCCALGFHIQRRWARRPFGAAGPWERHGHSASVAPGVQASLGKQSPPVPRCQACRHANPQDLRPCLMLAPASGRSTPTRDIPGHLGDGVGLHKVLQPLHERRVELAEVEEQGLGRAAAAGEGGQGRGRGCGSGLAWRSTVGWSDCACGKRGVRRREPGPRAEPGGRSVRCVSWEQAGRRQGRHERR